MSQFSLSNFFTCFTTLFLGIFVFFSNRKSKINRIFCFYSLSISEWSFFTALHAFTTSKALSFFSAKIMHLGVLLIPILFFHFCLVILESYNKHKNKLFAGYFISAVLILVNFTSDLIVPTVRPKLGYHYFMDGGFLYLFLILIFFIYTLLGLYLLLKGCFVSTGNKRNQLKYLLGGSLLGYIFGASCFLPVYNITIFPYPVGSYAISVYVFITTYAIIKYRLMDIAIAIKKTTLLAIGVLVPIAVVFMVINFLQPKLQAILGQNWWLVPSGITLLLTLGLFRFVGYVVRLKDEELNKAKYLYRKELKVHAERLARSKSSRELVTYTVRHISTIAKLDFCAIALKKEEDIAQDELTKRVSYYTIERVVDRTGRHLAFLKGRRIEEDSGLVRYLKRFRKPLEKDYFGYLLSQQNLPQDNPEFLELKAQMEKFGSEVIFPSFAGDSLVGLLFLGRKLDGSIYSQEDLELFSLLSNQAAKPISEIMAREDNIRLILASCRLSLAALEERDHYTRGHTERVKQLCLRIAQEEPIKSQIEQIPDGFWGLELASELHDLGKIGIPDNILNKPGKLTEEEFEYIKKHPQKSISIIGELAPWLKQDIISGIIQHQELYDGTGYPEGLKDDQIHIYARIIHVADALDAMTSTRPYRLALPLDKAIDEIKKNSGVQFDPLITGIAIKLYQQQTLRQLIK